MHIKCLLLFIHFLEVWFLQSEFVEIAKYLYKSILLQEIAPLPILKEIIQTTNKRNQQKLIKKAIFQA